MTASKNSPPEKRVAVVTGAARGIGAATVRKLASLGYAVASLDVNEAAEGRFYRCDVADAAAVDATAAKVRAELGPASVLVTSAALIPNTESIMDMDLGAHDRMWRVNYHGTVHACRSFGRQMVDAGRAAPSSRSARSTACCRCRCPRTTRARRRSRA